MKKLIAGFVLVGAIGFAVGAISSSEPALRAGDPLPENIFVELAKLVNPAVVNVSVSMHMNRGSQYRDPMLDMLEQFGFQLPPQQQQATSIGTGFVIEADGLAVTNNHVVADADEIKVAFVNQPGKLFEATVLGRDSRTDIALIKIKGAGKLPTLKLGVSKDVQVGQWVAAFGNPYGHSFSMTKGIISALGRQIKELNAIPFIQTDASINPGNSGGPLVNTHGEVIAVNSAIDARAQGIGFAIPIDYVKDLIPQLKEKGRISRGYIGVAIDEVTPRAKQALSLPVDKGAIIMDVMTGGPAEKAGIKAYDVVTKIGDRDIDSAQDLMDAIAYTKIGDTAKVVLYREGKQKTVDVRIGETPETKSAKRSKSPRGDVNLQSLGLTLSDWSDKIAKDLNISPAAPKQPIVVSIVPNSPAAAAGFRVRDLILDVNRQKVSSAADVQKLLISGSNMVRVQNGSQISLVFIKL